MCLTKRIYSPENWHGIWKNHPLEKEKKIKHLPNLHCLGSFILIFGIVSSKSMWKVYSPNPTETSTAKRQWHVHQRRQVQNRRSPRKLMPTRSIECSQKMWRCVVVAMYFDDFFSEIRLLIFWGGRKHKIVGSIYIYILIFQLSILKVNHFDQMAIFYLPGRFMSFFFLQMSGYGLYLPSVYQIPSSLRWGDFLIRTSQTLWIRHQDGVTKRWSVFNEDSILPISAT